MRKPTYAVLIGTSLALVGLEAGLKQQPNLIVQRIPAGPPEGEAFWNEIEPDVVIIDLTTFSAKRALALLQSRPGLPLIGLDPATDTLILLSSQRHAARTSRDLAQLIQELTMS